MKFAVQLSTPGSWICSRTAEELMGFLICRGYDEDEVQVQFDKATGFDRDMLL